MALDAQTAPTPAVPLHIIVRGFGLQAKRMAGKIDAVRAVGHFGNVKAITKGHKRVASRLRRSKFLVVSNWVLGT